MAYWVVMLDDTGARKYYDGISKHPTMKSALRKMRENLSSHWFSEGLITTEEPEGAYYNNRKIGRILIGVCWEQSSYPYGKPSTKEYMFKKRVRRMSSNIWPVYVIHKDGSVTERSI